MDRLGDLLLPGAALTDDEQWPRHVGNAAYLIDQLAHLGRVADDLETRLDRIAQHGVVLVEQAIVGDDLEQPAQLADQRRDTLAQVLAADQKVGCAGADSPGRLGNAAA